jgi:hypothetical protein
MSNSINMANMEAELRSVLQAVLMGVCQRCDFVHGEALRPSGNSCLVQSGASFCSTTGAADFHRASLNFYFPPNVSVAGRVWKSGCTEWHGSRHALTHARKTLTRSRSRSRSRSCLPHARTPRVDTLDVGVAEDVSVLPTTTSLRSESELQTER